MFLHVDSENSDAQADLSLHWAHRSFCWFCHEAAQINFAASAVNEKFESKLKQHPLKLLNTSD